MCVMEEQLERLSILSVDFSCELWCFVSETFCLCARNQVNELLLDINNY